MMFTTYSSKDIECKASDSASVFFDTPENELPGKYDLQKCCEWVKENNYLTTCLQFPETLLNDGTSIALYMQRVLERTVYILADTSYGSCCVDEVAAEHVNADSIIHFGHACLSPVIKLPVLYVFLKEDLDLRKLRESFDAFKGEVILFYDDVFHHLYSELCSIFNDKKNVRISKLSLGNDKTDEEEVMCGRVFSKISNEIVSAVFVGDESVTLKNLILSLPVEQSELYGHPFSIQSDELKAFLGMNMAMGYHVLPIIRDYWLTFFDYSVQYLSNVMPIRSVLHPMLREILKSVRPLIQHLNMCFQAARAAAKATPYISIKQDLKWHRYSKEGQLEECMFNRNKFLMQRSHLVEKIRAANVIGILIGTLGIKNFLDAVERIKLLVKQKGKKCYTLAVGKPNVAKLANFPEIDVFVFIACQEHSLLKDFKEYYKPIVSLFEIELALADRPYTSEYTSDFRELLPGGSFHKEIPPQPKSISHEISRELIEKDPGTVVEYAGAEFLANRTWRGLDLNSENLEVCKAVKGRAGIPLGYENELENLSHEERS